MNEAAQATFDPAGSEDSEQIAPNAYIYIVRLNRFNPKISLVNTLTLLLTFPLLATAFQAGKVNITDTSQNNHGCQSVSFKTQFQGSSDVKVFASLSHGNTYVKVHDPAALWVKSVSTTGFEVCAREAGSGSREVSVINWLAFQGSHQGIESGTVDFDEWTTRTQCKRVSISNQSNVSSLIFIAKEIEFFLSASRNRFIFAYIFPRLTHSD